MGILFSSSSFKNLFEIVQKPVRSSEELLENIKRGLEYIEEEMHIGKVKIDLSVPQTKVRAQIRGFSSVLYQRSDIYEEMPIVYNYRTGDGGNVVLTFYATKNYIWNEEELEEVHIIGNLIYNAFRVDNMNSLLDKALTTDLSVGIPNIAGFMKFVLTKFEQDILDEYIGIYFNIHNFKYVNNVLSHMKADEVMSMYVNMVKNIVEFDEIVARLGGDNFVALIRKENIKRFIHYISNINIIYINEGNEKRFHFSATIGASELKGISRVDEVMLRISVAYQVARQQESTDVVYYKDEHYKDVARQKEIIAGFHKGLEAEEFVVHYQPKVMTEDRRLCGAEALVRWNRQGTLVYPGEFIPILEKEGSICKLDFYVLDKACEMLNNCKEKGIELPRISINFSRKHIGNPTLVKEIVTVIDKHGIPHEYIEIELTESEDFKDYIVMAKLIQELKDVGISTSIDDFGTGYSSLNMLKMTSIDILKIDKAFIPLEEEYEQKQKDCIMFENIARLAKELGVLVVAEGVETKQQYEYLKSMGCDIIQGYYFDKPLEEVRFLEKVNIGQY